MDNVWIRRVVLVAAGVIAIVLGVVVIVSAAPTTNETTLGWGDVALGAAVIVAAAL